MSKEVLQAVFSFTGAIAGGLLGWLAGFLIERQRTRTAVGVNSHMAQVAFDKLVKFCERYHAAVLDALRREQQGDQLFDSSNLRRIRRQSALWLSSEVEESLDSFEKRFEGPAMRGYGPSGAPASNEQYATAVIAHLRNALRAQELSDFRDNLITQLLKKRQ